VRRAAGNVLLAASILAAPFGSGDPPVRSPALSRLYYSDGPNAYLLTWRARTGGPEHSRYALFNRKVDASGHPDGEPHELFDPGSGGTVGPPALSSGQAAWAARRGGRWAVYTRYVEGGGTALGAVHRLSPFSSEPPGRPAVVYQVSNRNYLVAWASARHAGVRARIVGGNGRRPTSEVLEVAPVSDRVSDVALGTGRAGFVVVAWTRPKAHDPRVRTRLVRTGTAKMPQPATIRGIDSHRVLHRDGHLTQSATEPTLTYDQHSDLGLAWTVRVHDAHGHRASAVVVAEIARDADSTYSGPSIVARAKGPSGLVHSPRIAFRDKSRLYDLVWARRTSNAGCGKGSLAHALIESDSWSFVEFSSLSSPHDPGHCAPQHPTLPPIDPVVDGKVLYAWERDPNIDGAVR
jgi:hypothetical protein